MADSGYSLQYVLANNKLNFSAVGSIHPGTKPVYWLKITIANPRLFTGQYALMVSPTIVNTFYYFDANAQKWLSCKTGIRVPSDNGLTEGYATHLVMQAQPVNTVYVKMDVSELAKFNVTLKPYIKFKTQLIADHERDILLGGWLIAMAVFFFFFLSNLYLYFGFKDKSVLYYLVMQAGGLIYITTYWGFFKIKVLTVGVSPLLEVDYYSVNSLLMHSGILLVMYGFVQLTRNYLNTEQHLPLLDVLLRWGLYIYCSLSVVAMAVNSMVFLLEQYSLPYDNIYLLLLVSLIIYTCIRAYMFRLPAAGLFLLANVLPLVLVIAITLCHVLWGVNRSQNLWLPNLAVVSQAFVFSIALVARTKLIQKELDTKVFEAKQLGFELIEIGLQHAQVELEIEKINRDIKYEKTKNELLQERLETNQRELASTALYMVQKNELLATLKQQIEALKKLYPNRKHQELAGMEKILQVNLYLDDDWAKFKLHFEQVHPGFFENLYAKHPYLTKNETRLCAYFHINLATKEIATLLNITPASVRQAKMRLFKKLGHDYFQSAENGMGEE